MIETEYMIPGSPRIALLSDLHGRDYRSIITILHSHTLDMVCVTGDFLYGSHPVNDLSPLITQHMVLPFLEACTAIGPTYLSLGNHEWMLNAEDLSVIGQTGVTVLDNSYLSAEIGGQSLVIGGLTSAYVTAYRAYVSDLSRAQEDVKRYPRMYARKGSEFVPEVDWLEKYTSSPGYHILLSHHPEYWPLISKYPVDICLSGHAHGGQWRFFRHGVWCPGQGFWPRWTKGVYDDRLVVSAGLANTAHVPRFFNPTEVVFIEPA